MLIAKAKKESNIIEYLLYMYQIEDIIRSFQFDLDAIDQAIVQNYEQGEEVKDKIKAWYKQLIQEMKQEGIERKGHLASLQELKKELQLLHEQLLNEENDKYRKNYQAAKPELKALAVKSVGQQLINEIDVALHGLYGLLNLRLKRQEISEQTDNAMQKVSAFLSLLALKYRQLKA